MCIRSVSFLRYKRERLSGQCCVRVYAIPRVSKQSAPTRIPASLVTRARLRETDASRRPKRREDSPRRSYIRRGGEGGEGASRDFQDPDMEIGRLTPRDAPPSSRCAPARYLIRRYVICRRLFFWSSNEVNSESLIPRRSSNGSGNFCFLCTNTRLAKYERRAECWRSVNNK